MSGSEYWDGEPKLAIAYKKAHEINLKRKNEELWMQGLYIKHALLSTVGNMFKDKNQEAFEYPEEPFPITQHDAELRREREEKEKFEKMKAIMMAKIKKG